MSVRESWRLNSSMSTLQFNCSDFVSLYGVDSAINIVGPRNKASVPQRPRVAPAPGLRGVSQPTIVRVSGTCVPSLRAVGTINAVNR